MYLQSFINILQRMQDKGTPLITCLFFENLHHNITQNLKRHHLLYFPCCSQFENEANFLSKRKKQSTTIWQLDCCMSDMAWQLAYCENKNQIYQISWCLSHIWKVHSLMSLTSGTVCGRGLVSLRILLISLTELGMQ